MSGDAGYPVEAAPAMWSYKGSPSLPEGAPVAEAAPSAAIAHNWHSKVTRHVSFPPLMVVAPDHSSIFT